MIEHIEQKSESRTGEDPMPYRHEILRRDKPAIAFASKAGNIFPKLWLVFPLLLTVSIPAKESPTQIILKGEEQMRGENSYSRTSITINKPRNKRTMVVDNWDARQGDKSFMRILEPKKDRGITFLKLEKNMWQYLPSISREVHIESSLMHDSWMGSDFTNDDLIKMSSLVKDYTHAFIAESDAQHHRIEFTPKPQAPVTWAKIIFNTRKSDSLPDQEEFYDAKGRLVKLMILSDFKTLGGRFIPAKMEMRTIVDGKVRSFTVMEILKMNFNTGIDASIFTKANLRR